MPQQVTLMTVLRAVPNALLQAWVKHHPPGDEPIPWDKLNESDVDPILDYLDHLPREQRDEMEVELQNVRAYACEAGMIAIKDAAKRHKVDDLMNRIPEDLDLFGRAMWVRLNEPEIFIAASTYLQLDQCQFWRRRNDVPAGIEISSDAKSKLSSEISILLREDGRGQYTTTEIINRDDVAYFVAHPDDYVRSENTHDEHGQLMSIAIRPTTQIIFAYDTKVGSLQLATEIKQPRKSELEQVFARTVLGWKLGPYESELAYQLNHLKDSTFVLATDPTDHLCARIENICLFNDATGRPLSVGVNRKNLDDTIHRAIEEELGKPSDSLWHLRVMSVEIKFQFPASRFRRASGRKVKVTPRTCNLSSLTSDRAEVVQKHLRMWGIDGAIAEQSAVAAVGI
jgi:hypothetical protein